MTSRPRKDRQAPDSLLLCMTRRILICSARVIFIPSHLCTTSLSGAITPSWTPRVGEFVIFALRGSSI